MMQLQHTKATVAALWVLGAGMTAVAAGVTSPGGLALVAGFGLVPPVLMLRWWSEPPQTLSESIREARR
jgi:hypothetical protein